MTTEPEIVHIISDYRSGSTLLDQLLGAHSDVLSAGEIHHLRAYATLDRSLHNPEYELVCTCGESIAKCAFWTSTTAVLGQPLESLRLSPRFFDARSRRGWISQKVTTLLRKLGRQALVSSDGALVNFLLAKRRMISDNYALYEALSRSGSCRVIVDSSKSVERSWVLAKAAPRRNKIILLCRDFRAVIHSKSRRGQDVLESARSWAARVFAMEALAEDLNPTQLIRLRYEDLCASPDFQLRRLCDFIGIPFSQDMLTRPTDFTHQIGGSPSKLNPERREIRLDTSYLGAFNDEELAAIRDIVGSAAKIWGYDDVVST